MTLLPLSFKCPQCGSEEVFYSCQPACCFNHVCRRCYTTFEPITVRVGDFTGDVGPAPQVDSTAPTAPCARCGEWRLFALSDPSIPPGQLLCISCGALLTLEITEVAAG